jgi:Mg-chelatase subunit ChlD
VAWPILLSNLTGELLGTSSAATEPLRPADPIELPLSLDSPGARVTLPDGTVEQLAPGATGASSVIFVNTRQLGVYRAEITPAPSASPSGSPIASPTANPSGSALPGSVDHPILFAVDLFAPDESNIAPGDGSRLIALGTNTPRSPGDAGTARDEFWPLLVTLALIFLAAEWLIYERDGARRIGRAGARDAQVAPAARQGNLMGGFGVALTAPELLIVGALLLALTLGLSVAARHHLSKGRRRLSLALRATMLAALVFALAGLQLIAPIDRLTTVFVVDLSDSVGAAGQESALAFVRDALEQRKGSDRAAVVAFGRDALVERLPAEFDDIDRFASVPLKTSTDIGAALRLASALFPDDTQKRIVLVSDGNDTTGRGQSEASLAAARGIQIETFVVGLGAADEIIVQALNSPDTARVGENINVDATISSTVAQSATVRLFGDGTQLGDAQTVNLEPGLNHVAFVVPATAAGLHTFRVVVEAAHDTFAQNNRGDSHTIVKGDPRILLIAGSTAAGANLEAALKAEHQDVTTVPPEAAPSDLTGFASYDSVILADVPATRLGAARMSALQIFTRDLGHGLVMLGGADSYGAGGYKKTPIEEALPVEMDVRDRQKQPDVALVVVIDESGSMAACHCNTANRDQGVAIQGIPKVDIGKEAIIRAVSALTSRDEFGVVAFNENAHWVIHTAPLGQIGDVEQQISGIKADGQTNVISGLSEAVASLEKASATRRHIVLFTDGWSNSGQYDALLTRMAAAGITLSTVGTGGGNADAFLGNLARQGGGRYYPATDPTTIPDIFLKETQQVSGQQIIEEAFFPSQTATSPILDEITGGLPQLLGYNGTTPKPGRPDRARL